MSDKLTRYIEASEDVAKIRALVARYAAGASDVAVTLQLNMVIDGANVPASDVGGLQRALAGIIRSDLRGLLTQALASMDAQLASGKAAAKAEYDKIFNP